MRCQRPSAELEFIINQLRSYKYETPTKQHDFLTRMRDLVDANSRGLDIIYSERMYDEESLPWHVPKQEPMQPALWGSKRAFIDGSRHIPGPWRIARVVARILKVAALGRKVHNRPFDAISSH